MIGPSLIRERLDRVQLLQRRIDLETELRDLKAAGTTDDAQLEADFIRALPGYSTRIDTESLEAFAKATGGKAYSNRNDLDVAMHDAIAGFVVYRGG